MSSNEEEEASIFLIFFEDKIITEAKASLRFIDDVT
jgi:hypothetical protein